MPQLRKRKAVEAMSLPLEKKVVPEAKLESSTEKKPLPVQASLGALKVGETIELAGFGGEILTDEGQSTSLQTLIQESDRGVIVFTYPKASTPGCKMSNVCCRWDGIDNQQALLRPVSFEIAMKISKLPASPSTVFLETLQKQTLHSRLSKTCHMRSCVIRKGH